MKARDVFLGSDGALTKRYYAELEKRGPIGIIAVNLFRAQKTSTRAKKYRGGIRGVGSFRSMAYDTKQWSLGCLSTALEEHGEALGINFGWGSDDGQPDCPWVFYVDLPTGQASFHSPNRFSNRMYSGVWDGIRGVCEDRIIAFCDAVYAGDLKSAQGAKV